MESNFGKTFEVDGNLFDVQDVFFLDSRPFMLRLLRAQPYGCYIVFRLLDRKTGESIDVDKEGWAPTDEDIVKRIRNYLKQTESQRQYAARIREILSYRPHGIWRRRDCVACVTRTEHKCENKTEGGGMVP